MSEKQEFITRFNKYVETHNEENFWMTPEQISGATGTTITDTVKYVESFDEFVKNSKGEYTTKEEYEKKTEFFKKLMDQIRNKIR